MSASATSPAASDDARLTDAHAARLAALIASRLEARPATMRELLRSLHGADPLIACQRLERRASGQRAEIHARRLLAQARRVVDLEPTPRPIPHPLDFAWLFDAATQRQLLGRVAQDSEAGDTVLYLGCPTLHHLAVNRLPNRRHLLLDADGRRVDLANQHHPGSARRVDLLRDPVPTLHAAMAVADPPWYPRDAAFFLNAAGLMTRPGATVLLAYADPLTRPSAERDLQMTIGDAIADGLLVERTEHSACGYASPPYERAAFAAAGYPGIPSDWRTGTLVTFTRGPADPRVRERVQTERWTALELDGIPVRLRADAPSIGSELLAPLVDGAVLPSVSRRDPRRDQVALWTSNNRVYCSSDPPRLLTVLREACDGHVSAVGETLHRIAQAERAEHGLSASA